MLSFYWSVGDLERAAAFIPKRLDGSLDAQDAAFAIDVLTNVNRLDEARVWVRRVMRRESLFSDPWVGGLLQSRVAEFLARVGDWEAAIEVLEPLRTHRAVAESATVAVIELRLAQALRAVGEGLAALREMQADPDPELAITVPGNEASRWEGMQRKLKRMEKRIRKALPIERQKEWGVGTG
jgi:hypothetical protein